MYERWSPLGCVRGCGAARLGCERIAPPPKHMRRQPAPCERRRLAGALLLLLRGASAYVIISSCGEGARCRDAKIQWARVPKTGSSTILSAVLAIEGPSRPPLVACGADRLDATAATAGGGLNIQYMNGSTRRSARRPGAVDK